MGRGDHFGGDPPLGGDLVEGGIKNALSTLQNKTYILAASRAILLALRYATY